MILRDKSQPGVFVARSGRAAWRPVKIGLQGHDKAEIIEGINPDELVIIPADTGTKGLTDGQRVKVTQP